MEALNIIYEYIMGDVGKLIHPIFTFVRRNNYSTTEKGRVGIV